MVDTSFASSALALSVQHWMDLGRGQDPMTGTPNNIEEAAQRITNILVIRLIALHQQNRFVDLATSTIARAILTATEASRASMLKMITPALLMQLETFVTCMLYGYNELPFHNYQHAYHVTLSANKFIESMLLSSGPKSKQRNVYGLGADPLKLLALIFSALIHDVGHTGVNNYQRAQDEPESAQKYGSASIHEHHSLAISFDELLKDEYEELRLGMFFRPSYYESFRKLVSDAVLSTDIANPERAEDAKIKFFDAFPMAGYDDMEGDGQQRRSSLNSNISMPRANGHRIMSRRASGQTVNSVESDITMDSYSIIKHQNKVSRQPGLSMSRRSSNGSGGNGAPPSRVTRRHSIETVSSHFSEFAADSICMTREKPLMRRASTGYGQRRLSASHSTDGASLIAMAQEVRRAGGARRNSLAGPGLSRRARGPRDDTDDYDDDSSLSLTPPPSDDELDMTKTPDGSPRDFLRRGANARIEIDTTGSDMLGPPIATRGERESRRAERRLSHGVERRMSSGVDPIAPIEEEIFGSFNDSGANLDIQNAINRADDNDSTTAHAYENPEDLQSSVIIELCLRAADVGHWYQSWDTMTHFNRRIFLELCRASDAGRGFDPRPNWFDNQAKIMQTYLTPLAEQIQYINILRRGSGVDLVSSLESNTDLWLVRGLDIVDALKSESQ